MSIPADWDAGFGLGGVEAEVEDAELGAQGLLSGAYLLALPGSGRDLVGHFLPNTVDPGRCESRNGRRARERRCGATAERQASPNTRVQEVFATNWQKGK